MKRWRCKFCHLISQEETLLQAPSPFDPSDVLMGCPHCKQVEGFDELCDEPTCKEDATCGFPTDDLGDKWNGYRRTCHKHFIWCTAQGKDD